MANEKAGLISPETCIKTLGKFIAKAEDTDTISVGEVRGLLNRVTDGGALRLENVKALILDALKEWQDNNPHSSMHGMTSSNIWRAILTASSYVDFAAMEEALLTLLNEDKVILENDNVLSYYRLPTEEPDPA